MAYDQDRVEWAARGSDMRGLLSAAGGVFLGFLALRPAVAATAVSVLPISQEPTKVVTVSGTGFGASEAVDVYLDSTDTVLLVSTAGGTFSGSVTLPAGALPGAHYATAIGRHSGVAAQYSFTVSTPWDQFGFGAARHGVNPYENVLSPSSVPSLGVLWSANIGVTGGTPAVVSGRVYVGTASGMASLNAATGAIFWNVDLGANFDASPTVLGTRLYIGDLSGNFYALNSTTGATVWKVSHPGAFYSSPVVANGIIYVGSFGDAFYALNATTGAVVWSYAFDDSIDSSPALANGRVYFGGLDGNVYCLNAATGALVWTYATGKAVESSPAIANGLLYVGSDDGKVYALGTADANAGQLVWSYTTSGVVFGTPVVYGNIVYVGSGDHNLYALTARSGAVIFSLATGATVHSAAAANGVVYFTSEDNLLYATSVDGSVLLSGSLGSDFFGGPAISDGRLFVGSRSGDLYALAPGAGMDAVPARKAPAVVSLRPDLGLRVGR